MNKTAEPTFAHAVNALAYAFDADRLGDLDDDRRAILERAYCEPLTDTHDDALAMLEEMQLVYGFDSRVWKACEELVIWLHDAHQTHASRASS